MTLRCNDMNIVIWCLNEHANVACILSSILNSFLSAITYLPVMTVGSLDANINIALPKYQQSNPTGITLDLNQISWIGIKKKTYFAFFWIYFIVSMNQISKMFGLIAAGLISDRFGRKKAMVVCSVLQILISIGVHFCFSFISLLIALMFSGCFNIMVLNPSYAFLSVFNQGRFKNHLY